MVTPHSHFWHAFRLSAGAQDERIQVHHKCVMCTRSHASGSMELSLLTRPFLLGVNTQTIPPRADMKLASLTAPSDGVVAAGGIFLLLLLIVLFFSIGVYRLLISPLRAVPGPKIAAITGLWLWIWSIRGTASRTICKLHDCYGMWIR